MSRNRQVDRETKVEQARQALLGLIRARGPGIKLPTIQEMCELFEVSRTPLEQALQGLENRGLLRRRRGSGIYVAETAGQKTVGVVFGGNIFSSGYSPFWLLLLQAVREQAGGCGFRPRAYLDISEGSDGLDGHEQLLEDLEARRLDGLLLLAPHHDEDEAARLRAFGIPLVVFGGTAGEDWRVLHDVGPFLRLAARELAAAGVRRVALMGHGVLDMLPLLAAELRQAGIVAAEVVDWTYETWATIIPEVGTHEHCAYLLTRQQVAARARQPLPDSLVSLEDTMTRGAIAAWREAGLPVGGELRIVTAANRGSPVLRPHARELIQIEYDPGESVLAALAMLGILMSGGVPPQNPVLIAPHPTQ